MIIKKIIFVGLAGLMLSACEGDKSTTLQDSLTIDNTVDTISNYDLGEGVIPFPNDFLFASDTPDGTLNIPSDDPTDLSDPKVAMSGLDGFSTVAPMTTGFTGAIDETSISGDSVRVYPIIKGSISGLAGPATEVHAPLVFGVDYIAALSSVDSTNSTLAILPLKPLAPKFSYAVVITSKLKSSSGRQVGISGSYFLTRGADPVYDLAVLPVLDPPVPPNELTEQDFLDALNAGSLTTQQLIDAVLVDSLKPSIESTNEEVAEDAFSAFSLELLRIGIVKPTEDAIIAADTSITSPDIILHWTFTTQSTTDVLAQVRTDVRALTPPTAGFGPTGKSSPLGAADISVGSLTVPYYLTAAANGSDQTTLDSFWKGVGGSFLTSLAPNPGCLPAETNVCPVATSTEMIPTMISTPKVAGPCVAMPGPGWPVVIYQHGITTNRATMQAVADAMAGACMAVVAIDMPMHGITGNETNGTEVLKDVPVSERTFDLDLVTQDTDGNITAEVSDGVIDTSGRHFINLSNLQNTRDNVRQAVSDLFVLVDAIDEGTLTDGSNKMDPEKIYFLGHSLGAMVGTVFTALEPNVKSAAFAFGGASLAKILDGSATFGPSIAAGLAAKGVIKGTADYEAFLGAAQTVVDSGDPVNFAFAAANPMLLSPPQPDRGVLFFEIVGGNSSPSDLVVPNTVPDGNDTSDTVPAPLAGTEPQLALMGLTHVNATVSGAVDLKVVTKFISGYHGSLLDDGSLPTSDPLADPIVTTEIQTQAATFFAKDGKTLLVTDDTVLLAPTP